MSTITMAPLEAPESLKARAYRALRSAILQADIYADGVDLRLDERALSHQFGISRTPLREAIAQLEQEGLVTVQARRGVFIVRKTKAQILEMITVWAALESMAARLATQAASDTEIAALSDLVEEVSDDAIAQRMGDYSDANIRFHQAIIALGKSDLIARMTDDLFVHMRAIRRRTIVERDRARRSIDDHRKIVEAIAARDADRAERRVRVHTLKLRDHVAKYVELDFADMRSGAA